MHIAQPTMQIGYEKKRNLSRAEKTQFRAVTQNEKTREKKQSFICWHYTCSNLKIELSKIT